LQIVDLSEAANPRRYQETFDESFYDVDGHGNVHVVLRGRTSEQNGRAELVQTVRIRSVWRGAPSEPVSDPSQINAVVSFFVTGENVGDSLEGGGAFHFSEDGETLTGSLDRAVLRPMRQIVPGEPLFTHAEICGEFRAKRDARRVVQIANEAERRFGPLPAPHARAAAPSPASADPR
jgi:hypothetical protein